MATLFDIGDDLTALMDLLDETDGEITPDSQAALDSFFTEIGDAQADKLQGYATLIRRMEAEASVADAEAAQWARKAEARSNSAKRLKDRLKVYLEATGQKKVQTSRGYTISVQANGGVVPLVLADAVDMATVPEALKRMRWELDRDAIRLTLEAGGKVPFASLGVRGSHVRVR